MEKIRRNIYFPKELFDNINKLAEKDMRSFPKECIYLLICAVEQRRDDLEEKEIEEENE